VGSAMDEETVGKAMLEYVNLDEESCAEVQAIFSRAEELNERAGELRSHAKALDAQAELVKRCAIQKLALVHHVDPDEYDFRVDGGGRFSFVRKKGG